MKFISNALKEDVGNGDHTSLAILDHKITRKAQLVVKDNGVIAGVELANMILKQVDKTLNMEILIKDGSKVNHGDIIFIVSGNPISILTAERLVLNCMQHMSGIATKTTYLRSLIEETNTKLLDTRKTTPLNRIIEKWAVRIGGGYNHRFGLYDAIMIKDNHIDFSSSVTNAIQKIKEYLRKKNKDLEIIVEARNIDEVSEILKEGGVKRILLDNFDIQTTKKAVNIINKKIEIESSGGITSENLEEYAKCGVDYISVGELTYSIKHLDLSLKSI